MIVFYSDKIDKNSILLDEEEARHCAKVLRKNVGEQITVLDGAGGIFDCNIVEMRKREVLLEIKSQTSALIQEKLPEIGICLLKNPGRFEWFLEKAVEIGVRSIQPLISSRTEKKTLKEDRSRSILISAMKQSMRPFLPVLQSVTSLEKYLESVTSPRYICHYAEDNGHLYDVIDEGSYNALLIGPEGDFSDDELKIAEKNNWKKVNIGNTRLRSETAALMALQIVNTKNRNI
jgi:16S rRNA (uracil1498-N3)-methyltransferase